MPELEQFHDAPWARPFESPRGLIRWMAVADKWNWGVHKHWYLIVTALPDREPTLLGYLSVDDPKAIPPAERDSESPTDLRVDSIWLHPDARKQGIATRLGIVAKEHSLFESHSPNRTLGGTIWAESIGDTPPPVLPENEPDEVQLEAGCRKMYERISKFNPELVTLPF